MHIKEISDAITDFVNMPNRDACMGGRSGSSPLCPLPLGAGGARIALPTELSPSFLSCKRAFSVVVNSLIEEKFSGG